MNDRTPPLGCVVVASSLVLAGCIRSEHPLDADGTLRMTLDAEQPLFAAPPPPITARQRHGGVVTISMQEKGEPAERAFVDITAEPPGIVTLASTDDSCQDRDGAFRCIASSQGFASFRLETVSDYTGVADGTPQAAKVTLSASGRAEAGATLVVQVAPAGAPAGASLQVAVGRIAGAAGQESHVKPSFSVFQKYGCVAPTESVAASMTRSRPVKVLATAPTGDPGSLANAPVVLSASTPEAEFSTTADCATHTPRLALLLDAIGETPEAYVCFSDVGGDIELRATSGLVQAPGRHVTVDAEPAYLTVMPVNTKLHVSDVTADFEVQAFDALGDRVALDVQARLLGTGTGKLDKLTDTTSVDALTVWHVVLGDPGTLALQVAPEIFPSKSCTSPDVTILP
jgi:hypothetical protein